MGIQVDREGAFARRQPSTAEEGGSTTAELRDQLARPEMVVEVDP